MSLITINADVTRVVELLERIANALDRAVPPVSSFDPPRARQATEEDVRVVEDEHLWLLENVEEELQQAGLPEREIPEAAQRILEKLRENPSQ